MIIGYKDFRNTTEMKSLMDSLERGQVINVETRLEEKIFKPYDKPTENGIVGEWIDVHSFRVWFCY